MRDYSVVTVISNLTRGEATKINGSIINSKEKYAPNSRGTSAYGKTENVSSMLGGGQKNYLGGTSNVKKTR